MKKFGFTLAEVIVTLGIIGLLAAITAPLLGSLTPDQNKIKVLKAYKILGNPGGYLYYSAMRKVFNPINKICNFKTVIKYKIFTNLIVKI